MHGAAMTTLDTTTLDAKTADTETTEALLLPTSEPRARKSRRKLRRGILWRDHVRVGLGSKWLGIAGYRKGLRSRLAYKDIVAFAPGSEDSAPWQAAVDALPQALAGIGRSLPAVTVVLSNHFVRYALLPWNAALRSESEWLGLARHRFVSVHGPAAEQWQIRVAHTGRERPRIASAIDTDLLHALKDRVKGHASLVSVQPYLMAAYNRLQPAIGESSCWLVIEEPGRLTLALIERGAWRTLRSRHKDEAWRATLPRLLDRESALVGVEEPCTEVVVCTHVPFDEEMHGVYRLRDLTFPAGADAGDHELAMVLE